MAAVSVADGILGQRLAADRRTRSTRCSTPCCRSPTTPRARLVEAMRYAAIGGGKRIRPLLLAATAEMYGVDRTAALRAGVRDRGDPRLFADPRRPAVHGR